MKKTLSLTATLLAASVLLSMPVHAQSVLQVVAQQPPGSGSDAMTRAWAECASRQIGQPTVVQNKAGANGILAINFLKGLPADGQHVMSIGMSQMTITPYVHKQMPYDPIKDFTPIGMIGSTPNVLVVNANLPIKDVKAFIDYVKKNPGRVSYGSAGAGSLTHLTAELFKAQTGAFMVHIPYRGIAPATNDVIAGQTQAMFPGLAAALPHIRSGRIRALAVTGAQRHPALKDVPTMEEAGLKGFDAQQWYGVVGPAGMPAAVVKQLNDAMATVLAQPDFRDKLSAEAVELMPMNPTQFADFMKKDLARWTDLAKERQINLDAA